LRHAPSRGSRHFSRQLDTSDFHVEVIDLLGNKVEAELGDEPVLELSVDTRAVDRTLL
jgi:hypothetical protein